MIKAVHKCMLRQSGPVSRLLLQNDFASGEKRKVVKVKEVQHLENA